MMLIDAFQPEGVTHLAVDSIFMMPQLGVLAQVNEEAALQVFERDCLIHLGTCIAPVGQGEEGRPCLTIKARLPEGEIEEEIPFGQIRLLPLGVGQKARVYLKPRRRFDVGAGRGNEMEIEVEGGVVGLILDTRGRPLDLNMNTPNRVDRITEWMKTLNAYPNRIQTR